MQLREKKRREDENKKHSVHVAKQFWLLCFLSVRVDVCSRAHMECEFDRFELYLLSCFRDLSHSLIFNCGLFAHWFRAYTCCFSLRERERESYVWTVRMIFHIKLITFFVLSYRVCALAHSAHLVDIILWRFIENFAILCIRFSIHSFHSISARNVIDSWFQTRKSFNGDLYISPSHSKVEI